MLFNLLSFTKRNTFLIALLLLVSPFMQADWFALNMTRGSTDISNEVFELHMLIFWICVAIGVIVFSVMFYSMWAHTKKKNPVPAKFHENHKLEIAWTIIPFLILIAMAVPASKTLVKIYDDEAGDINIQVTGYQWKWQYRYLEDDVSFFSNLSTDLDEIYNLVPKGENYLQEVDEMVVIPAGKKVRFLITANDVIHSWWLPAFAIKQDAIPGFVNTAWTIVDEPGIYRGKCTELCGKNHGFMPIVVKVVEQAEYDEWVFAKKQEEAFKTFASTVRPLQKSDLNPSIDLFQRAQQGDLYRQKLINQGYPIEDIDDIIAGRSGALDDFKFKYQVQYLNIT